MDEFDFKPLVNGIRACFPAITRDRHTISPKALAHNGNVISVLVRVIVDERFPTFNSDGLMTLIDATEMKNHGGQSSVKGTFDGKPCEIILVTKPPAA